MVIVAVAADSVLVVDLDFDLGKPMTVMLLIQLESLSSGYPQQPVLHSQDLQLSFLLCYHHLVLRKAYTCSESSVSVLVQVEQTEMRSEVHTPSTLHCFSD